MSGLGSKGQEQRTPDRKEITGKGEVKRTPQPKVPLVGDVENLHGGCPRWRYVRPIRRWRSDGVGRYEIGNGADIVLEIGTDSSYVHRRRPDLLTPIIKTTNATRELFNVLSIGALQVLALSNAGFNITGHTHGWVPVELDLFAGEEAIDLLQREVARLRVEEVNEREETEVENCSEVRG